jgi:tRNA (cmo5U34)-methyltransferase
MACSNKSVWQFDSTVASIFDHHVRCHIPHYDSVVEKTCRILERNLDRDDPILEVGCSNGMTLQKILERGFCNLHGVDNSQAMIDSIPEPVSQKVKISCSSDFPESTYGYSAVICNWTLHFVPDKKSYLQKIYQNLRPGGWLILSEKTSLDHDLIEFYHLWKHDQGVSWQEISQKQQAIQDIMFVDPQTWYQDTLADLGFDCRIIDADWVFTTFLCRKASVDQ